MTITKLKAFALCVSIVVCLVNVAQSDDQQPSQTPDNLVVVSVNGKIVEPTFGTTAGCWFFHSDDGSQALLLGFARGGVEQKPNYKIVADLNPGASIEFKLPQGSLSNVVKTSCKVRLPEGNHDVALASVQWRQDGVVKNSVEEELEDGLYRVESELELGSHLTSLFLCAPSEDSNGATKRYAAEVYGFAYETAPSIGALSLEPKRKPQSLNPIETSPNFSPTLQKALIEWDWQMQDGIGTEREPQTYEAALALRLPQGRALIDDLKKTVDDETFEPLTPYDPEIGDKFDAFVEPLEAFDTEWARLEKRFANLHASDKANGEKNARELWLEMRRLKRRILTESPYFQFGKLLFVKGAPSVMSHQLTQVYGYCARPGGGLFVLDQPGRSMEARDVTPSNLPLGSYMTPELSFDSQTLYFSYCDVDRTPKAWRDPDSMKFRYHLYSAPVDKLETKLHASKLTDGDYDDFAPLLMPDGDLVFCSTRRGGFHRCGAGPCYVYTLARSRGDGSDPRPISFHETNEWFPTLAHDGRIVYTRWDYVDRDAVYYQQLWSARQDGTDVRIAYGNNTFNPPGFWEPKSIPGSDKIMAVGGPHHGMSAGSVVLIDSSKGVDGVDPIQRLTPDVLYPEGEAPLPLIPQLPELCDFDYVPASYWQAVRPAERAEQTPESRRWPVHCFKSPIPLSEKYFIASYSYDKLLGEAGPNLPNQFGIYFCDAFGGRELIYRDLNVSSMWAIPVRPRPVPPRVVSQLDEDLANQENPKGAFFLQNVYESWPNKLPAKIKALRIVQVLPKTTPNANQPMVGAANASPGKQVLGTVPVEEDGSAFFEAPARTPLFFQALDENGRMVQGMRSLVYLQPGETAGCVGCHEDRTSAGTIAKTVASTRKASKILPPPDGANPFSFPILVQPVLNSKCLTCHNNEKAEGNVNLSGDPDGHYTKSYNALVSRVAYTAWGNPEGNYEPLTEPDRFGARASALVKMLDKGHYDVRLSAEEWERLNTWIDANALFYGTFNVEDQLKQQRGERIDGPELE